MGAVEASTLILPPEKISTKATKMSLTKQHLAIYILLHLCCLFCHCHPQYGQRQYGQRQNHPTTSFRNSFQSSTKGLPDSLPVIVRSSQIFEDFERRQQDIKVALPSPKLCPYGSSDPDCL